MSLPLTLQIDPPWQVAKRVATALRQRRLAKSGVVAWLTGSKLSPQERELKASAKEGKALLKQLRREQQGRLLRMLVTPAALESTRSQPSNRGIPWR